MIRISVTVAPKTARRVLREVGRVHMDARTALFETVADLTLLTHQYAVQGVQRGPASGRVYRKFNPRRVHRASAPGEYPATDTGRLAAAIQLDLPSDPARPEGQVFTNLRYGLYLEMKSPARGGRPWLLRSYNRATVDAVDKLRARLRAKRKGR